MAVCSIKLAIGEVAQVLRSFGREVGSDEWSWDEFEVADGVTTGNIFPGNITTVDVLYFESSQVVTIFLNSSATATPVDADGVVFLIGTAITALTITNGTGNTANIKLGVWGT